MRLAGPQEQSGRIGGEKNVLSLPGFQPQIFQNLNIANSWEETFTIILNYNCVTFLKGLKQIIKISGYPTADCDLSVRNAKQEFSQRLPKQEFLQRHRGRMDNCQS
jgi:hypothetical protein